MPTNIGYWSIRGLGQSVRLMLEYTGEDYKEKRYNIGPAPGFDMSEWFCEKFDLGYDFPNLPYLDDGKHKVTQSHAVLRYLARKHSLAGKTEDENVRIDVAENELKDWRTAMIQCCYNPDFEKVKPEYLKTLKEKLESFSKFLCTKKWLAGDNLTWVDFLFYELLDINKHFCASTVEKHQNLHCYTERFEGLMPIRKYINSPRYIKFPIYGSMASWGGKSTGV